MPDPLLTNAIGLAGVVLLTVYLNWPKKVVGNK